MSQTWIVSLRPTASRRLPGWNCAELGEFAQRDAAGQAAGLEIINAQGLVAGAGQDHPPAVRAEQTDVPRADPAECDLGRIVVKQARRAGGQPPGPEAMVVPGRQEAAVGAEPQGGELLGEPLEPVDLAPVAGGAAPRSSRGRRRRRRTSPAPSRRRPARRPAGRSSRAAAGGRRRPGWRSPRCASRRRRPGACPACARARRPPRAPSGWRTAGRRGGSTARPGAGQTPIARAARVRLRSASSARCRWPSAAVRSRPSQVATTTATTSRTLTDAVNVAITGLRRHHRQPRSPRPAGPAPGSADR